MLINYNIPDETYNRLMSAICKEYDEKFDRLSYIANHIPEGRYELPTTVGDRITLKMGVLIAYIKKPPGDIFDIEYKVEFKMNTAKFVQFVDTYLKKYYYFKFNLDSYIYKDEFYNDLARYISEKYHMNVRICQNKGYIQFDVTVWMCPNTRIIYI